MRTIHLVFICKSEYGMSLIIMYLVQAGPDIVPPLIAPMKAWTGIPDFIHIGELLV